MNLLHELIQVLALVVLTILFHFPVNLFLTRCSWRAHISPLLFSALINFVSWMIYRALYQEVFDAGRTGFFLSGLILLNAIYYWVLLRFSFQEPETFREDRLFGWIVFSPLVTLMVLISTPLIGALLLSLIGL